MTINVIVAVSDNGVIGKDGKIPWKLSTDLERFKKITLDDDNLVIGNVEYLKKHFKEIKESPDNIFISGRKQEIYDEIFKTPELIHRVYLTRVHCNVEGDAFFGYRFPCGVDPWTGSRATEWQDLSLERKTALWNLIDQQFIPKSDKDEYDSTFQVWENKA